MRIHFIFLSILSITLSKFSEYFCQLTNLSSNGIIEIDQQMFQEYLENRDIDFNFVILFTTNERCNLCDKMNVEFEKAAFSFKFSNKHLPLKNSIPIYFFKFNFNFESAITFEKYNITSTPTLYLSQLGIQSQLLSVNTWIISPESLYDTENIIKYINARINTNVEKYIPFSDTIWKFVIALLILIGAFIVLNYSMAILQNPETWFVLACFIFFVCIGGVAYNILRNVPVFGQYTDKEGKTNYLIFSRTFRGQYALEGYIFSAVIIVYSFAIIGLTYIPKMNFSENNLKWLGLILIIILIGCFTLIIFLFKLKMPSYGISFTPPDGYVQGPLSEDRGISI